MNKNSKRLRQISIFESFSLHKKKKTLNSESSMNNQSEIKKCVLAATEKRLLDLHVTSDLPTSSESKDLADIKVDDLSNSKTCVGKIINVDVNDANNSESCPEKDIKVDDASNSETCAGENMEVEVDDNDANNPESSPEKDIQVDNNDVNDPESCAEKDFVNKNIEPGTSKDNDDECFENDNDLENSADLFPDEQFSLEDHTVPNSAELFADEPDSQTILDEETEESDELDELACLNRIPDCSLPLPKLEPLQNHSIMFSPHIRPGDAPRPYPPTYRDKWDSDHVRMPCSPQSRYPLEKRNGEKRIVSRWELICHSLRRDIGSSKELEEAIMMYNDRYVDKWNFQGLHAFINKRLKEEEREHFFETILPGMVELALDLPNICTQPVPLLKRGRDYNVTLSQKQIGSLLLNAFFCTFPRRTLPSRNNRQRHLHEYASYPDINFNRLFAGIKNDIPRRNAEKLQCLFNYFRRIICTEPSGTVTFHRQFIPSADMPEWNVSTRGIRTAVIKSTGLIETDGQGMLQVDFANKFVGGGVLGHGCVQEEIRFIICPELIVSRLFVEYLGFNEVLIVTGVEQYNKYSGYCDSFKWEGDFKDDTPRDSWGRRYTQLVAMDATHFTDTAVQFKHQYLIKELNKAYSGFYEYAPPQNLPSIATGNWGCGAFKGDPKLKFLIQLMAASEAGRSLLYFTFGNKALKNDLKNMYTFLTDINLAVGDVWRLLSAYAGNLSSNFKTKRPDLYDFIYSQFRTNGDSNTEKKTSEEKAALTDSDKQALEKLVEVVTCDDSTDIEDG